MAAEPAGATTATPAPGATTATPAAIRLAGIAAGYDDELVLRDVDLEIAAGSLVSVVGPNGAGKSTLLKIVAGLLRPRAGRAEVLGGPPGSSTNRIAYVPQAELVDWQFPVSVGDVVAMGRYPRVAPFRRLGVADREAIEAGLERVGMTAFGERQIGRLSGGQRRRVFLARALAAEPDLYLLDEPVTGIDLGTQDLIMDVIGEEARAGRTVVATTHDLMTAAERFDQVVAINRTVIAHGPARQLLEGDLLERTYGGHLLVLDDKTVALDDAHHHDQPGGAERHYHEGGGR